MSFFEGGSIRLGKHSPPRKPGKKYKLRWGRAAILAAVVILLVSFGATAYYINQTLPQIQAVTQSTKGSVLYDLNNQPVTELGQNSIPVSFGQIPANLQDGVVAVEDSSFWTNPGFDIRGILRAAFADLTVGRIAEGASTITEQLARNLFLSNNKTITRKLKELLISLELEHVFTKQEILTMYLNREYFGQGSFGVGAAAHTYFGTDVQNLDLAQCSLVAGLLQAPSLYDPFVDLPLSKKRQKEVLGRMVVLGYITQTQADAAYAEPLHLSSSSSSISGASPAPYFVDYVTQQLLKRYSAAQVYNGGLKVYTTLDMKAQVQAEASIAKIMNPAFPLPTLSNWSDARQAAMVVMNPHNGYILAMVGGRTHPVAMPENLALADFPPGSAIKPLAVYTPAIASHRYTQVSVLQDVPWMLKSNKPWPQNDDKVYRGYISVRQALAISDNNASVQLLNDIGINTGYNFATQKFGLPLVNHGYSNDHTLSLAIGGLTRGVNTLNMADAYATFAAQGVRPQPISILKVFNRNGTLIWENNPSLIQEFSAQINYIAIEMMKGVLGQGPFGAGDAIHGYPTGTQLGIGRPSAGKTGTDGDLTAWFVGFTPQLVAAVWEGSADLRPQPGIFGATYAGPIWQDFMRNYLQSKPIVNFTRPPGLVTVKSIDYASGMLPGPLTPPQDIQSADFLPGTEPTSMDTYHVLGQVWQGNENNLWDPSCGGPPISKVFVKPPDRLLPNLSQNVLSGIVQAEPWLPNISCTGQVVGNGSTAGSSQSGNGSGSGLAQTLSLDIQNGQFLPSTVNAAQGSTLTLNLRNADNSTYTFNLPALGINGLTLPPQSQVPIQINNPTLGTFQFNIGTATGKLVVQ